MKSIEVKFAEACEALTKAGKRSTFDTKLTALKEKNADKTPTIEVQLNMAEAVLAEAGVVREANARRTIKKHNGAADNGHAVVEFRESGNEFSEGYVTETHNPFAETDNIILESMRARGEVSEDQVRVIKGDKPAAYANLTEGQRKEYDFARMVGISEADCFTLVKITGGYSNEYETKNARR